MTRARRAFLPPCALVLLGVVPAARAAQLAHPGLPASATAPLPDEPVHVVLPRPDLERLRAEDDAHADGPFRYGVPIPVALDLDESGRWDGLESGALVWRLRLTSPGAESLGVLFDEYELPPSGRVFLYDPARATVLGAFTCATRQPNGMLAVQPLRGDDVVIEYAQDAGDPGRPRLRVGQVIHDYRGVLRELGAGPLALVTDCKVDVNCPPGAPFQDVKRSVIMVLMGGGQCSAGLLNNTAQDGTPYFLTASHCGDMSNVVAVFGYENAGCDVGPLQPGMTLSGATLLARSTSGAHDSQLYLLSTAPPPSFAPFYAGWDARSAPAAPGVSISHPSGSPKKVAIDEHGPEVDPFVSNQWVVDWELGRVEPGSSGSPLLDGAQRVIGPLCCGRYGISCGRQQADYGRFDGFFGERDLERWLDPLGLGVAFLDGFDPHRAYSVPVLGSGANPLVYASTSAPALGATWTAAIDVSAIPGASDTWILGCSAPSSGIHGGAGELLVDLGSTRHFLSRATSAGGVAIHSSAIPNDPLLVGETVHTQALVFGGGSPRLTNGVRLHLR